MHLHPLLRRLLRRTNGDDLIEYALLSTAIALAAYLGVTLLGSALGDMDAAVSNASALSAPCTVSDAVANTGTASDCPTPDPGGDGGGDGGGGGGGGGAGGGGRGRGGS